MFPESATAINDLMRILRVSLGLAHIGIFSFEIIMTLELFHWNSTNNYTN